MKYILILLLLVTSANAAFTPSIDRIEEGPLSQHPSGWVIKWCSMTSEGVVWCFSCKVVGKGREICKFKEA